jgi:1-acyl-sn-glycerol-3-phosphate acyltransferase
MSSSAIAHHSTEVLNSKVSPWLMSLLYPIGYHLILPTYFGKIEITGQENIPKTGPLLIAPTHRSRWDAMLLPAALGRKVTGRDLRFMVTSDETEGIQGWFIRRLGGFPIDVKHPGATSLLYSVALLKQGEMLVIFPEGAIIREKQVTPLKRGVARIALDVLAQVPDSEIKILPVSLNYSQTYPTWGTDVQVKIGEAIAVKNYDIKKIRASSEKLTQDLQERLKILQEGLGEVKCC